MKDLKNVPNHLLNDDLKVFVTKFPKQIESWRKFLEKLGFITTTCINPNTSSNGDDVIAFSNLDHEEAFEKSFIIAGVGYVSLQQIAANSLWPDTLPNDDQPSRISVFFFADDKAEVDFISGPGTLLFEPESYFNDQDSLTGTWDQVAEKLVTMRKEILQKLELNNPPATN